MPPCPQCGKTDNVHSDELHVKWIHMCHSCGHIWWTNKPKETWIPQNQPNPQDVEYHKWLKTYLEEKRNNDKP